MAGNHDFSKQYDFEIDLNGEQKALAAMYKKWIIYIIVATSSANCQIIQYSRSYSKKFKMRKAASINRLPANMPSEEEMKQIIDSVFEPFERSEPVVE